MKKFVCAAAVVIMSATGVAVAKAPTRAKAKPAAAAAAEIPAKYQGDWGETCQPNEEKSFTLAKTTYGNPTYGSKVKSVKANGNGVKVIFVDSSKYEWDATMEISKDNADVLIGKFSEFEDATPYKRCK